MMFDRLPHRDDPAWTEAPLDALLRPLTSDYIGAAPAPKPEQEDGAPKQGRPRKKWSKVTPEQEDEVAELIRQDMPYAEIATRLRIGQSTVERIASQRGIGRGRGKRAVHEREICAVPGCGAVLKPRAKSGVCIRHRHAVVGGRRLCRCVRCASS